MTFYEHRHIGACSLIAQLCPQAKPGEREGDILNQSLRCASVLDQTLHAHEGDMRVLPIGASLHAAEDRQDLQMPTRASNGRSGKAAP